MQLEYVRDDASAACPEEVGLRDAVAARLGYVPFDVEATRHVRVQVRRSGRRLVATIEVIEDEEVVGARELGSRAGPDVCPIADALVLAVSLAIDPMTLGATASPDPATVPECADVPAPQPCPECVEPPADAAPVSASAPPFRARLLVGALFALAPTPQPSGGARLGAGVRVADFSADFELRGDVPTSGSDAEGRTASATWLSLGIALCGHVDVLSLCALSTTGALIGWGENVDRPRTELSGFSTLGARAALELPLDDTVAIAVSADAGYVLTPTDLVVDGRTLHTTPPLVASLGVSVIVEIL